MKTFLKTRGQRLQCFLAVLALTLAAATSWAGPSDLASWKPLAEGGAVVEIAQDNASGTNGLQINVKQMGSRFGIVCADTGLGKIKDDQWYDVTFNAQTDARKTFALIFSLESPNGKIVCARTTLPEVGRGNWQPYNVALHVHKPAGKCRMVITFADTGSISLNNLSVVLRQTN